MLANFLCPNQSRKGKEAAVEVARSRLLIIYIAQINMLFHGLTTTGTAASISSTLVAILLLPFFMTVVR